MTDREYLELAAKAAGIEFSSMGAALGMTRNPTRCNPMFCGTPSLTMATPCGWR